MRNSQQWSLQEHQLLFSQQGQGLPWSLAHWNLQNKVYPPQRPLQIPGAMCLLDAAIGTNVTNGCSSLAPYCVTGLIGPTCSVCAVVVNGTSVGCTNEGETCGAPSCVRDLPLSCKVNHEASCPSKRPTSLTPTSRKPTTRKPRTRKPATLKPTTLKPTSMKPTTMKPNILASTPLFWWWQIIQQWLYVC